MQTGGRRAQRPQARGIFFCLHCYPRELPEHGSDQRSQQCIAPRRTRRQTAIDQIDRQFPLPTAGEEIWPQLRFQNDEGSRLEMIQEATQDEPRVIGKVDMPQSLSELPCDRITTGGSGGRDEHIDLRQGLAQGLDQRDCRRDLANRYCMDPQGRLQLLAKRLRAIAAKPLGPALAVARVAQSFPPQPQGEGGKQEQDEQSIERPHRCSQSR